MWVFCSLPLTDICVRKVVGVSKDDPGDGENSHPVEAVHRICALAQVEQFLCVCPNGKAQEQPVLQS